LLQSEFKEASTSFVQTNPDIFGVGIICLKMAVMNRKFFIVSF